MLLGPYRLFLLRVVAEWFALSRPMRRAARDPCRRNLSVMYKPDGVQLAAGTIDYATRQDQLTCGRSIDHCVWVVYYTTRIRKDVANHPMATYMRPVNRSMGITTRTSIPALEVGSVKALAGRLHTVAARARVALVMLHKCKGI